jgi:hypothetical protein
MTQREFRTDAETRAALEGAEYILKTQKEIITLLRTAEAEVSESPAAREIIDCFTEQSKQVKKIIAHLKNAAAKTGPR